MAKEKTSIEMQTIFKLNLNGTKITLDIVEAKELFYKLQQLINPYNYPYPFIPYISNAGNKFEYNPGPTSITTTTNPDIVDFSTSSGTLTVSNGDQNG
jgi:hypothetical protein